MLLFSIAFRGYVPCMTFCNTCIQIQHVEAQYLKLFRQVYSPQKTEKEHNRQPMSCVAQLAAQLYNVFILIRLVAAPY